MNTFSKLLCLLPLVTTSLVGQERANPVASGDLTRAPYRFVGLISSFQPRLNEYSRGSGVVVSHPRVAITSGHVLFDEETSATGIFPQWNTSVRWHGINASGNAVSLTSGGLLCETVQNASYAGLVSRMATYFALQESGQVLTGSEAETTASLLWPQIYANDIAALVASSNLAGGDFAGVDIGTANMLSPDTSKLLLGFPSFPSGNESIPRRWDMHQLGPLQRRFAAHATAPFALTPEPVAAAASGNSGGPWLVKYADTGWLVGSLVSRTDTTSTSVASPSARSVLAAAVKRATSAYGTGYTNLAGDFVFSNIAVGQTVSTNIGEKVGDVDVFKLTIPADGTYSIASSSGLDLIASVTGPGGTYITDDNDGPGENFLIQAALKKGAYRIQVRGAFPSEQGPYSLTVTALNSDLQGVPSFDLGVLKQTGSVFGAVPLPLISIGKTGLTSTMTKFPTHTANTIPPEISFRIRNTGTADLLLAGSSPVAMDSSNSASSFAVITQPAGVIPRNGTSDFRIRFTARRNTAHIASFTIASNDALRSNLRFRLVGLGKGFPAATDEHPNTAVAAVAPSTSLIDAFSQPYGEIEFGGDKDIFELVVPQTAVFIIYTEGDTNTAGVLYKLSGSKAVKVATSGDSPDGLNFRIHKTLAPGRYLVEVSGQTVSTEGSYRLRVGAVDIAPLLAIVSSKANSLIVDETEEPSVANLTDFGSLPVSSGKTDRTFTLKNMGTASASINPLRLEGTAAASYSIVRQPIRTLLAPGQSTTFSLRFDPTQGGDLPATVAIPYSWDNVSLTLRFSIAGVGTGVAPPQPVAGFALIPAGTFTMGDTFAEGSGEERPTHSVNVAAFYMGTTEVTWAQWQAGHTYALANGYTFDKAGGGVAATHPVHSISWYDVVKWCNARSQQDGRTPAYTVAGATYKTGQQAGVVCSFTGNGYRLPTEAEWEKAARGGQSGKRFPWGDTITHLQANYYSSTSYAYDTSATRGYHPTYNTGTWPYTSPVGIFAPNGYGLYDMAGNVWEWCWDWFDSGYYAASPANDPRGASNGSVRVFRGGSWVNSADYGRVAVRSWYSPSYGYGDVGFRLARGSL